MTCPPPANGINTEEVAGSAQYVYDDEYEYVCRVGYTGSDNMVSTCQADGTWSLSPPTCTGKNINNFSGM